MATNLRDESLSKLLQTMRAEGCDFGHVLIGERNIMYCAKPIAFYDEMRGWLPREEYREGFENCGWRETTGALESIEER